MTNDNFTDPYAAKTSSAQHTAAPAAAVEDAPATVPAEAEETVPEGSVNTILDWVGEDKDRAALALKAEEAGANRASAVKKLNAILD